MLPGAEAVILDLVDGQHAARERAGTGAEEHRVVRIEIEIEVVLEVRAAQADQREMALADLGARARAEKAA